MKTIRLLQVAMLSVIVAFTSCNKDELSGSSSGEEVTVTLSTQLPSPTAKTRVVSEEIADIEGFHLRYILEVWTTGANPQLYNRQVISAENKAGKFELKFLSGQTYDILLWSDYVRDGTNDGKDLNADLHYLTPDLKTVSKVRISGPVNTEFPSGLYATRDAFYAYKQVNASADIQEKITLKRAVAQVNIFITDLNDTPEGFRPNKGFVSMPTSEYFDISTGIVSANTTYNSYVNIESTGTEGTYKAYTGYVFTSDTKSELSNFTVKFYQDAKEIASYDLSNIPVQRNYRTNITGALLTKNGTISVETEASFEDPDNEINAGEVSSTTPDDLQTKLLAKINDGSLSDIQALSIKVTQAVTTDATIDLTKKSGDADVTDSDLPRIINLEFMQDITGGTTTLKLPDAYTGVINVKTQTGASNLTIEASGASVNINGTYGELVVSSGLNTCTLQANSTVANLDIKKGNLFVLATAKITGILNIESTAGDYSEIEGTAGTININKSGHNLRILGTVTTANITVDGSNIELLTNASLTTATNTGSDNTSTLTIFEGAKKRPNTITGFDAEGQKINFVGYTDNIANSFFLIKDRNETGTVKNNGLDGLYYWQNNTNIIPSTNNNIDGRINTYQAYINNTDGITTYAPNACYAYNKQTIKSFADLTYYMPSASEIKVIAIYADKLPSMSFDNLDPILYWGSTRVGGNIPLRIQIPLNGGNAVMSSAHGVSYANRVRSVAVNTKYNQQGYPYLKIDDGTPVIISRDGSIGIKTSLLRTTAFSSSTENQHTNANNNVPAKFRVAKKDVSTSMDWYTAMNYKIGTTELNVKGEETGCATYYEESDQSDKGKWRLPNLKEMILIGMMGPGTNNTVLGGESVLNDVQDFTPFGNFWYFVATESFAEGKAIQYSGVNMGLTNSSTEKTAKKYVRCVRDVE